MKPTISQEQLRDLEKSGAKITKSAAAGKPETLATTGFAEARAIPGQLEQAMLELAGSLTKGQKMMLEELQKVMSGDRIKPTTYQFTINRDKRGLIADITATPIEG